MFYSWKDYHFDLDSALLTKQGEQVVLSRKALRCIVFLIAQRHRVVPYEELIREIWGHDDVSNHQLTQIIVAARRALGDDGHLQTVIRTMPGRGYRWIQPVEESSRGQASSVQTHNSSQLQEAGAVQGLPSAPPALATSLAAGDGSPGHGSEVAMPPAGHRRPRYTAIALLAGLVAVGAYRFLFLPLGDGAGASGGAMSSGSALPGSSAHVDTPSAEAAPDSIDGLREAMQLGKHELVRVGLLRLPAEQRQTPDASMLRIELEIERGRFDEVERMLAVELEKARSAEDRLWQAKLLMLQSESRADAALGAAEVLPPAKTAVALLESAGEPASSPTMGRALSARGNGFLIENDLQAAVADLVRARDALQKAGDERRAAEAQRYLAHVWLREGRTTDALAQILEAAVVFERLDDPLNEIAARNMATRIQVEQLRWDEALAGSERSLRLSERVSGTRRSVGALHVRSHVLTHLGRLREARNVTEEVQAIDGPSSYSFDAAHALAAGRPEEALTQAAMGFREYGPETRLNLNLESREGALLLWVMAAQAIAERGESMPVPTPAQRAALERPESDIGRIAYGRWLWSQGRMDAAETQLRLALTNPRATGRLLELLYANEALIEMLVAKGEAVDAQRALDEMWGRDPERFKHDYRANLLALRVALASGDDDGIATAYRQAVAQARERALPMDVVQAYAGYADTQRREGGPQMASVENAP